MMLDKEHTEAAIKFGKENGLTIGAGVNELQLPAIIVYIIKPNPAPDNLPAVYEGYPVVVKHIGQPRPAI